MKNSCFLVLFFLSIQIFSQNKAEKLGVFTSLETNIGLDLATLIRDSQPKTDYEKANEPPQSFSYGFHGQLGYQPLNWFAISAGLRYSYVIPNYHLLYLTVQPQFFISDPQDQEFEYLFANFGTKINSATAENAGFVGLGFGKILPMSTRFGQKFQVFLEDQIADGNGTLFLGISYGIILFSNKKL